MNILITGIEGYIGSVMGAYLTKRGHKVRGVDTGFFHTGILTAAQDIKDIIHADTRNLPQDAFSAVDAVIHLADLSNDPLGTINQQTTREINYEAAVDFAKRAKQKGVSRYVYASSCSVYGIAAEDLVTEESMLHPQTMYARCKRDVEIELRKMADDTFSPVIMRNATVYGVSPRMRFDLVVNNLVGHAVVNKEIRLTSDGSPWRPLVHVRDVCLAFACAVEAPKKAVLNETFNVGDSKGNYQIAEVAAIIKELFPDCDVRLGTSDGDTRSYRVSFDKINTKLPGFSCGWDVRAGVLELKKLLAGIDFTNKQFESRDFTRLKQMLHLLSSGQIDSRFYWKLPIANSA